MFGLFIQTFVCLCGLPYYFISTCCTRICAAQKAKQDPAAIVRLLNGQRVRLKEGETFNGLGDIQDVLRPGEVGTIVKKDHSKIPYEIRGPRGDTAWFRDAQVVSVRWDQEEGDPPEAVAVQQPKLNAATSSVSQV